MAKKRSDVSELPNHKNDDEPEDLATGLKPNEWTFALYFATCGDPVQAYLDAGYQGTSYDNTHKLALELVQKPRVQVVVRDQLTKNADRYRNDALRVVEELKTIAFSSIDDYEIVGDKVKLKPGVDRRALKAIKSIKSTVVENHRTGDVETKVQVEMWDKGKAIDLAMRHHGLLQPDMPPLEVVLARLPNELATKLRSIMINEADAIADGPRLDEAFVDEQEVAKEPAGL